MAPVTAQRVPGGMAGHNRDVADLWKDALKTYKGIKMQNFHKFRHDDKKVDKLRGLFSANLDYIEKGAQYLGGARKKMDLRIRRLREATELAILDNTEEIQKMTPELRKNQHSHTAMHEEQMQVMSVFYFREQNESLLSFANGVISVFNQVAEQSPELCEAMYAEIVRDQSQINQRSSDDLLPRSDSNVQESSSKPPLNIEIARGKQMDDLRTMAWARINSLSALKKFSRYVRQRAADKTEEIAPIKIRSSGPRPSFFDILEKPLPRTLYQLYEVTTAECFRRTESSRRAETRAKIQSRGGWGTAVDELEKAYKASQSDELYQDGKLPIKFRERSMRGFFGEEPVAPNDGHRPRRSEAHRQMFLTCCNFIQPEHPSIMSNDKGVPELQDAVGLNSAEASFSAANGALRLSLEMLSLIRTKDNPQAAYEDIQACLRQTHDESVPLPLRRSVYNTKAQIETKLGRRQDAGTSYELARSVDPSNLVTGDALRAQIKLFEKEPGKQDFIRTLKTWSSLERLAYLCWDTWDSVYQAVIRAAVESGEVAFVVQMYQDSIRLLDNVNAFAPLLVELGLLHINVTRDLEAARPVFDQALDSGSTGWSYAVMGEAPEATLDTANTF
ncbi:hypothetical protein K4K54_010005 [Colletotrichum sp. SAR 10_86]|nr:hypothetical protein KHU50_006080 [Colletotrichum sp. SAR 10_65]KAI8197353.1 hypothetical protein K4K52_010490 [Colletotrichum sp. SAR 10_76]KAI8218855.1 hypothetical protein K4K54_010005 [Colletotrichum sp. SAR 10_86]